jgi:hypothetical protein
MTNNRFINISWADTQTSLGNEHFSFPCVQPVYTRFIFENNTVENQDRQRLSFIYFQMNLNKDGLQDAYINNNRFINVQYIQPGLVRAVKDEANTAGSTIIGKGFRVFFQNNYFERITNVRDPSPVLSIHAQYAYISNLTVKNSDITTFIYIKSQNSEILNVRFIEVNRGKLTSFF